MGFRLATVKDRAVLVDGDHYHDVEQASAGTVGPDPMVAVAAAADLHDVADRLGDRAPTGRLDDVELGPPVPAPRSVFAIGLNYQAHADEGSMEVPEVPLVFTKFPGCIVGPTADVVLASEAGDYEAELVVVMGRRGRHVAATDAWDHIAGVMAGQDISDRVLQFAATPPHFDLGKSRDTYGPTGPMLVSTDLLEDPDDLAIECRVNGEVRQSATTADLIFDVPTLVEYLSSILTLEPGDLVFTGTPDGVGAATLDFLADGDVVTTSLAGVGELENRCVMHR
jgi:2-keto-4-pentenoate hydratase/2-oxohepta-3-ene-1,7-dioic acid hydratase in catechol pathway